LTENNIPQKKYSGGADPDFDDEAKKIFDSLGVSGTGVCVCVCVFS